MKINKISSFVKERQVAFLLILALLYVLILNGAVPFLSNPDYAVSFWVTGFAQSIANQDLLALYADNIGYPALAPVVLGLPRDRKSVV